jgi:signal transduction histidine kinase
MRAFLPRPRPANPVWVDLAVALAMGAVGLAYLWSRTQGRLDLIVGAAAVLGATLLAVYSATVPPGSPASIRGIALAVAAVLLSTLGGPRPGVSDLVPLSLPAAIFVLARVQTARQLHAEMVSARAEQLEREQEQRAREAVAEERARIARELHDVVAHSVGVIVVQAQGAERVMSKDPEATRQALNVIAATGREAMAEMSRVVGMLRAGSDGDSLVPQPGLAQLDGLLLQMRATGLRVTLNVEGPPRHLAPGLDLAAYRVVQEALTNCLKHAGPAEVKVSLKYQPRAIDIEVSDDGPGTGMHPPVSGHGLVGLRERVVLYGGTIRAEKQTPRGFKLSATLPLDPSAP